MELLPGVGLLYLLMIGVFIIIIMFFQKLLKNIIGNEKPTLILPSFSCGFPTIAVDAFILRCNFSAYNIKDSTSQTIFRAGIAKEQQSLDTVLKKCGLHLKAVSIMNLPQILSYILTGQHSYESILVHKLHLYPFYYYIIVYK